MYTLSENLDNTEFSEWINEDILIKDSRRSASSRKRDYDLANVDLGAECEDIRRRVLRPRPNVEPQSSNGASRTRPIRSNRARRRTTAFTHTEQTDTLLTEEAPQTTQGLTQPPDPAFTSSANELSFFQALVSYNWPQNYLLAHTDPSLLQRLPQTSYSPLTNIQLGPRMPQFDPWVLHNYLLASSNFSPVTGGHLSTESGLEDSARNMSHLGYPSLVPDNVLTPNLIWQYPFLLNPPYNPLPSHTTRPEMTPNMSVPGHTLDHHLDLSYLFTSSNTAQRNIQSNSNEIHARSERVHGSLYPSELPTFNNHMLPSPFTYGSLCPYHNTSHILHSQQSSRQMPPSGSSLPEPSLPYPRHTFSSYPHPSEMSFGQYWPPLTSPARGPSYPINSSNIDTLLHLAAHFEQRKRGITREELEKLPTHRYKALSDKCKHKEKSITDKSKENGNEDLLKCLVCLDDFEAKQSIRTLRCSHDFHAKCIDKWLKINRSCPLCRADAFDGSAQKDAA